MAESNNLSNSYKPCLTDKSHQGLAQSQPAYSVGPPSARQRAPFKVTTDTNNNNYCTTKHMLPYNFNNCYGIYLKLTDINGVGMPGTNKLH